MNKRSIRQKIAGFGIFLLSTTIHADLPDIIEKIKPSIVAIGTYKKTQSPPFVFRGTGFVVESGNLAVTNAHVLPEANSGDGPELAILIHNTRGDGSIRQAQVVRKDAEHDLAIIRFGGPPLPALSIGDTNSVREGQRIAFTGFPIGGALGFSPVTHQGSISSITPIVLPMGNANQLNEKAIQRIKHGLFDIFQLDATAYPGNSGSPVYEINSATVIGVINMVFVKGSRESALSQPTGISYAIPSRHLSDLLDRKQ